MEETVKYLRKHTEDTRRVRSVVLPVCIVVDISGSMNLYKDSYGVTRIQRINEGISQFLSEVKNDDMLYDSVEIAIVTFSDEANVFLSFSNIDDINNVSLVASRDSGDTPKGVEMALQMLEQEKNRLKDNKIKYQQPWLVIFSDGRATPGKDAYMSNGQKDFLDINRRLKIVQDKTTFLENEEKLTVIPVLISEPNNKQFDVGLKQMKDFSATNRALVLGEAENSLKFKDFFKILSKSISVNNSNLMFQKTEQKNISQLKDYSVSKKEENYDIDYSTITSNKVTVKILANKEFQKNIKKFSYCFNTCEEGNQKEVDLTDSTFCKIMDYEIFITVGAMERINELRIIIEVETNGDFYNIDNIYQCHNSEVFIDLNYFFEKNSENKVSSIDDAVVDEKITEFIGDDNQTLAFDPKFKENFISDDIIEEEVDTSIKFDVDDTVEEEKIVISKNKLDIDIDEEEYLNYLLEDIDDWDEI